MFKTNKSYLAVILVHVLLGVVIFIFPFFAKVYAALIIFLGLFFVVKHKNKNNEVLYVCAYAVGAEVLLRMTHGYPVYEFSKYSVIIFSILGMFYSGISKNALPYWIFLFLLIPSILIATETLNLETDIRKTIAFNISGPICLGFSSLYAFNRKISFQQINDVILAVGLPIVSMTTYLMLYTPDIKGAVTGTDSNFMTSGGFGPNQVATVLGIGMFVFFSRLLLASPNKIIFFVNLIVTLNISYRGLVTFSRGGIITGLVMIIILLFFLYINTKMKGKVKLNYIYIFTFLAMLAIWFYASNQTSGLIEKRYSNQDALGRTKSDLLTGRGEISVNEIDDFFANPIFGIGVAKGAELRAVTAGEVVNSHNEVTRMLAEHGSLGIMGLLILFFTPIILYLDNKQNIYVFCFLAFWLLTINHAAMRIAAPAFLYSFSLLKIKIDEKPVIYRE